MCIICFKPENCNLPSWEILENCFNNNPDGAGYAILRKNAKNVYFSKGFFSFHSLKVSLQGEKIASSDIVAIHFRIATNGAITEKNCHPFYVCTDKKRAHNKLSGEVQSILMHNGILNKNYAYDKSTSDSLLFTVALASVEKLYLAQKRLQNYIEKETIGSRILYINKDGTVIKTGDWVHDDVSQCYFSNNTFKYDWTRYYTPAKYKFFDLPACPVCGETINIEQLSKEHDLHICNTCYALFDSEGLELELRYVDYNGFYSGENSV